MSLLRENCRGGKCGDYIKELRIKNLLGINTARPYRKRFVLLKG